MHNNRHPSLSELKMELAKTVRFQNNAFPSISSLEARSRPRTQNQSVSTRPTTFGYTDRLFMQTNEGFHQERYDTFGPVQVESN
mgnify:CR=1 FL=1